jgi:hypothetical protein
MQFFELSQLCPNDLPLPLSNLFSSIANTWLSLIGDNGCYSRIVFIILFS